MYNNKLKEDEELELVKVINSSFLYKYDLIYSYIRNKELINFGYIGVKNFESNGLYLIFKLINDKTRVNFSIDEFYRLLFSNYNQLFRSNYLVLLSIIKSSNIKALEMYLQLFGYYYGLSNTSTSLKNSKTSTTKPTKSFPPTDSLFTIKTSIEKYYSTLGFKITNYKEFKYFNYLQRRFQKEFPSQLILKCTDFGCFNNPFFKLKHLIKSNIFINYVKQFNQAIEMDNSTPSPSISAYKEIFTQQQLNSNLHQILIEFTSLNNNNNNNSIRSNNDNNKLNHFQFRELILNLIYNYYSIISNKPFEYYLLFSNEERVIKECKNNKFYNYEIFLNFRFQESDLNCIFNNKLKKF